MQRRTLGVGAFAFGINIAAAETVLKFGHYNAETHPIHQAALQFRANV